LTSFVVNLFGGERFGGLNLANGERRRDGASKYIAMVENAPVAISRRAVYGLDARARDSVQYVDHGTVVYCAGKSVVTYDVARETQQFLQAARDVREITAVAAHVASSMIALAVIDHDGKSSIAIYDVQSLKREKTLTRSDVKTRRSGDVVPESIAFDGLAFSSDGDSLLGYSTTEHALVVWNIAEETSVELPRPRRMVSAASGASATASEAAGATQFISNTTSQITHALFSPHEVGVISAVCAGGVFRTYRVNESTIKLLAVKPLNELVKDVGRDAKTHVWLRNDDKHVAIGTSTGEVLILDNEDVVGVVHAYKKALNGAGGLGATAALPESEERDSRLDLTCMRAYNTGFIVAGDRGDVIIVERCARKHAKDGCVYKCVKTLAARESKEDDDVTIHSTALAFKASGDAGDDKPEDDSAVAPTQIVDEHRGRVVSLDVSPGADNLICVLDDKRVLTLSLTNADIMQANEMRFDRVLPDAHLGGISCADVCICKPIIVSVSAADKTVRIWNLITNMCEVVKEFPDSPLCVSLHPSGWIACVGFSDKLRLMHILNSDLRIVKEFALKACRAVEFSKGGHLVASAVGATIYIHHTFTFEPIAVLRGHCSKVKSLTWRDHDSTLISSGGDGAIYEWDVHAASRDTENSRRREHVHKGCAYTSVTVCRHTGGFIACADDSKLKEFDDEFNVVREFSSDGVVLTHVAYGAKTHRLFAATATGGLRAYKVPLTGEFVEYPGHVSAVTMIRLSADETSLHTVGEDGCLLVYDVHDAKDARAGKSNVRVKTRGQLPASDEVLIMRGDLDESHQRIAELQTQVKEVTLQAQYQLRLKTAEMNDKVKTIEDESARIIAIEKQRIVALERERDDVCHDLNQSIEELKDAHAKELTDAADGYANKMFTEVERYDKLKMSRDNAAHAWEELKRQMMNEREESELAMKRDFAIKLNAHREAIAKLENERDSLREEFTCLRRVMDEEVDSEIEQLKSTYEARIKREHEVGLVLRGENGVAKTKYAVVKQHEDARLEEISGLKADKATMSDDIVRLNAEAERLRELIHTHERTLDSKNMVLSSAKTELSRAEKHIAVLAKEVSVLKERQQPLEEQLSAFERDIETMNEELLRYYNSNSALVRQVCDVKSQRDGLQRDIARTRKRGADTAEIVKRFQRDLQDCANSIQDAKALKENVKAMYHKYTVDAEIVVDDETGTSEEKRQRDHLEKTVAALQRQIKTDAESRRVEFHRVMQENQNLIQEVESLRMKSFTVNANVPARAR